jgi:hypothetical protein
LWVTAGGHPTDSSKSQNAIFLAGVFFALKYGNQAQTQALVRFLNFPPVTDKNMLNRDFVPSRTHSEQKRLVKRPVSGIILERATEKMARKWHQLDPL